MSPPGEITRLLRRLKGGDAEAREELIPLVYDELRRLAGYYMREERRGHTLQPTALVHEAFLRLAASDQVDWQGRAHFFAVAARIIRNILVDHARSFKSQKKGGEFGRVAFDEAYTYAAEHNAELLALDEALNALSAFAPRQREVVELRFFGGLSEEEIAEVQGVSVRTVKRDWRIAKSWLYARLS
jgi:RNA polymerase sigma factor (TIGR02999 family)